jgi:hypothetical protein
MKKRAWTSAGVALLVLALPLTACGNRGVRPPKTGKIIEVTYGSAACLDERTDTGTQRSVAVRYTPAGTDHQGDAWPDTFACVTIGQAEKYEVGGTYP